ncbi:flagellar basal body P-ring formation chaperone FlgA [Dryocola sp. BD613]|uniref:flagellar basal body P-ring formation chaperone FlgA n=1 Tax=Dryocola sp. BD613 TaxID=3133272 RepID=UPI003F509A2E
MPFLHRLLMTCPALLLCGLLCFIAPFQVQAEQTSLESQIAALLNNGQNAAITRSVRILTPPQQLAGLCAAPQLSVSGNDSRITGNRSVIAQCGQQKKFIQVNIQAEGSWWTASRAIKAGSLIQAGDITAQSGTMARLPPGVLLRKDEIVGQVTTRAINTGQPIVASHLRKRWKVSAGQEVDVFAAGEGFQIRTRGKALDNAALDETLRVKTASGQIVSGKVTSAGKVHIFIKE